MRARLRAESGGVDSCPPLLHASQRRDSSHCHAAAVHDVSGSCGNSPGCPSHEALAEIVLR